MDPNDSGPQQPPDYNFILNPTKPPSRSPFTGGGMKQRIILVGAGLMILLVLITIVGALLGSGKGGSSAALLDLAAEEQEIMRIAQSGYTTSTDPGTRGIAATVELSLASQQKRLIDRMKVNGIKVTSKELALKKSSANDKALESAKLGGRFDDTFLVLIRQLLTAYITHANDAYKQTKDKQTKDILAEAVNSSMVIVKQQK